MSISDYWIKLALIFGVLIYLGTLIAGLMTHKLAQYVFIVNAISGLAVLIYWVQKQIRISQHIFEAREMIFLGFELLVVTAAIYSLLSSPISNWLKITQYIFFAIQFICLVLLLAFFLFFKMNKLV